MIVTSFPILLMFASFMEFLFTSVNSPRSIRYNPLLSPVKIFFCLHTIPRSIKYSLIRTFKKYNNLIFFYTVLHILLLISGTVEVNPGPDKSKKTNLSFAVWNLDSIPARDFARIPLIETLQATYNFDIFGVCESFLNNDISNDDILIRGFSPDPFRAGKPVNIRNGGVCLYFKENLPIKERIDLEIIPEPIVAEVKLNRKKIFFVLSKKLLRIHPSLVSMSPSHRDDGSQSCIDLVCTDQSYVFTDTGVLPFLDPHSKHNIIHGSLNFHIPCPPPYKRKVWEYKTAKSNMIRLELFNTNWHSLFLGLNASEMSLVFTDVLLNIFSKNISNKIITCNDKDAPWITPAIRRNSRVYRKWVQRGRISGERDNVRGGQNSTNKLINAAKRTFYVNMDNKLSDPNTGQKHFWTAFKRISNKKKQTNIPPIFENNCYVIFSKKPKHLTITLQNNVKFTIMGVSCLNLSRRPMLPYLKSI